MSRRRVGAKVRSSRALVSAVTATALLATVPLLGTAVSAAHAEAPENKGASASERAAATGKPVEVVAERTEYSTVNANPDGTYTLAQSITPVRARAGDGTWHAVDATLERRPDGSVGPRAAVVDLSFSGGGAGENLIRLGKDGRSISLGWPTTLPEPTLEGATATYSDVFDGVDLRLTATSEGYREVLVVKNAEAAASPDLRRITLRASGDGLQVLPNPGGGLRAVDGDGNTVLRGPAGLMWDSAGDSALRRAAAGSRAVAEPPVHPAERPDKGDAQAVLPVQVGRDSVTVKPDTEVLSDADTVYPVYIDPPVGLNVSERTVLSSDGDRFWQFDDDLGVGRCSAVGPYYCGSNYVNRMYFEFGPSALSGKYVLDATFRAYETWSFSCTKHVVDLERTNNISESTRWPGPTVLDHMGDQNVSAGRGDACSPEQPATWVEFNDNPGETDENLTSTVRKLADGSISRLTLMLKADDEDDADAWKRFKNNASLQVTYVPKPGVPTDAGVIPGNGTTQYCNTSSTSPLTVTRTDPMVQARVQTQVQPKSGEDKGSLQAEFRVARLNADGTWEEVWTGQQPTSGWDPDGTLEKMRNTRTNGITYRYRARTQSHWSYDGKSGDLYSSFSSWCYFKIDSTAPGAPQIFADSPYVACDDVLGVCDPKGGPGRVGSFTFKPNTADKDITAYRWRLITTTTSKEVNSSTPASCVNPPITSQNPAVQAKACVTPQLAGTQVLSVEAKDVNNRWGAPAELKFKVSPAAGAVGRWHFDDGAPSSGVVTAVDSATEGATRNNATLYTTGSGWGGLGRRGDADYSLWLNDTTEPDRQSGYAATSAPAVNTRDSFTISTWAYLTDASVNQVVMAEPGQHANAFTLYYSASTKTWVFNRVAQDTVTQSTARSIGDQLNPPLRVWTHLAAVFRTEGADGTPNSDPTDDTIQLFVNGRAQGQPVRLSAVTPTYQPWTATGGLQWGRSVRSGVGGDFFKGRLDETAVWQRSLSEEEIRQEAQVLENGVPATEMVASWDATVATGSPIKEGTQYLTGDLGLSAGASVDTDDNLLLLNGTSGYASTTGPVVDETGSFTVTARVRLSSSGLASKPDGYRAQVLGQQVGGKESSWALWAEKLGDGIYVWKFGRTAVNGSGSVTQTASVAAEEPAVVDDWVQVTGVFDAQEEASDASGHGKLHLFVTDKDQASGDTPNFTVAGQGAGELAVGRGTRGGAPNDYLPGALAEARVWIGALTADQISTQVLGTTQ
ncbi:LamG domain-containing protein [Actinacidiphila glaucinigra]|uniref:LamG domain-containing protein n=1 Tax=Actinacidiphila glaucinigra TaxID=235986 RepID=UPI0033B76FE8